MYNLIDDLRAEHIKTDRLLNLLEQKAAALDGESELAVKQLGQLIKYFGLFRERVHHKKEDMVYEAVIKKANGQGQMFYDLQSEHRLLHDLMKRFLSLIEGLNSGKELDRENTKEAINEFVSVSRAHMQREELNLFPLAEKLLSEEDWAHVARRVSTKIDTKDLRQLAGSSDMLYKDIVAFEALFGDEDSPA